MKRLALGGVLLAGILWSVIPATAATRVALVSTCGGKAGENLLTLTDTLLSKEGAVEVLERRQVERVLDEQHLLRCGLSEAASAVIVGRLLDVEVFASLETVPGEKDALGLVIFDAHTGVKLWDAVLAGDNLEKAAHGVSVAVALSLDKRGRLSGGDVTTLCLGTVRNAALPRNLDSLSQSVGMLLERRLLDAPSLAVVDRRHLENVNKERALPTGGVWSELLGALVTVDLDLTRRDDGKGIKATALLKNAKGADLGRLVAESPTDNAADLAEGLTTQIAKQLGSQPPKEDVDRVKEAARYRRETKYLWSEKEYVPGLQAAEAAAALDATNDLLQLELGDYLAQYAVELAKDKKTDLDESLHIAQRAFEIAQGVRRRAIVQNKKVTVTGPESKLGQPTYWQAVFARLGVADKRIANSPPATDWREFQRDYRQFVLGVIQRNLASRPGSNYELFDSVSDEIGAMEGLTWNAEEWTAGTVRCYELILPVLMREIRGGWEMGGHYMLTRTLNQLKGTAREVVPHVGRWQLQEADLEKFRLLYQHMREQDNFGLRVYGLVGSLILDQRLHKLSPDQIKQRKQEITESVRAATAVKPSLDLSIAALNAIDLLAEDEESRQAERADLFEFMLARRQLNFWVVWVMADPHAGPYRQFQAPSGGSWYQDLFINNFSPPPDHDYHKCLEYLQRTLTMLRSGDYTDAGIRLFTSDSGSFEAELKKLERRIYEEHRDLAPGPQPAPWQNVRALLDATAADSPVMGIMNSFIQNDSIYAIVQLRAGRRSVIRQPLAGGPPQFAQGVVPNDVLTCFAVEGDRICVGTRDRGIQILPWAAGVAQSVTTADGLPSDGVTALSIFDGKIYAGLTGGYLVRYDLGERKCEVLAASRRREKRSPLDDVSPALNVTGMRVDAPRKRVLFLASTEVFSECNPLLGLWQVDAASGDITQLLETYRMPRNLESTGRGTIGFEFGGWRSMGSDCRWPGHGWVTLDPNLDVGRLACTWRLSTVELERLPAGPRILDTPPSRYIPSDSSIPYLVTKNWAWYRWSGRNYRISSDTRTIEEIPPLLGPENRLGNDWTQVYFVGDGPDAIMVGPQGIWRLTLNEGPPAPVGIGTKFPEASKAKGKVLVLWNTYAAGSVEKGAKTCNVVLKNSGKTVWRRDKLPVEWEKKTNCVTTLELPDVAFDAIRVEITEWVGQGGGLAEIELAGEEATGLYPTKVQASGYLTNGKPEENYLPQNVLDGQTTSATVGQGYWLLPENKPGWIEITYSK